MKTLFSKTSRKHLAGFEVKVRTRLLAAIDELPNNGDVRKLKGQVIKNVYRLRIGRYRVLYAWEKDEIKILDIDTRGDIYK
jgi:mRNA interferase RelE/StbE